MASDRRNTPTVGHALNTVPGLPEHWRQALQGRWLETVEQVLGLAATPPGHAGLRALLACSAHDLDALLARLDEVVSPAEASRLRQPTPGGACGLLVPEPPGPDETPTVQGSTRGDGGAATGPKE
jgi:hypothetical protein